MEKRRPPPRGFIMANAVELDAENQLLRVQFSSGSTVENWKKTLVQVKRLSKKTGIFRVIVDVRKQTNIANTFELFDFGSRLPSHLAFAVLCEIHLEAHRFIETVATNRGILVKDFDSDQYAMEWLKNIPNKRLMVSKIEP